MAMVKPLVREPQPLLDDDDIFLIDAVDPPETSTSAESLLVMNKKNPFPNKLANSAMHTPHSKPIISNTNSVGKKWCRQEDTVKRKRTSVAMLGKLKNLEIFIISIIIIITTIITITTIIIITIIITINNTTSSYLFLFLGVSSDDSEVQEIANLLREQSRHFGKRTKSMP